MYDLVLRGIIVDLFGTFNGYVGINDDIIEKVTESQLNGKKEIDAKNCYIFPGFIDPHVHLRVPGGEQKEDFYTGSRAAIHGGITTVIDMPNTNPPTSTSEVLEDKISRAKKEGKIDILFYSLVLPDNIDKIKSLENLCVGYKVFVGKSTGGFILPMKYLEKTMEQIPTSRHVTFHCEDQDIIDNNTEKLKNEHYPEKHCDVRSSESEYKSISEVLSKSPIDCKVNIAHVSTEIGLDIIKQYKKRVNKLTCEVTPHHLLLIRDDMKKLGKYAKMNPPLRTHTDRLKLIEGLKSGLIDFLASDHAPHTKIEKCTDGPSGVPGLDTYGNVVTLLMKLYEINPQKIMHLTSYNAANFFGLIDRGRIEVGKKANITILDPNNPTRIPNKNLYTKCRWSPFEYMVFPGQVMHTIINGKVVSKYDEVFV